MKELKRTKRLSVSIIGYLAIVLIGFLSFKAPSIRFSEDEGQILTEIEEMNHEIFPDEALAFIEEKNPAYLFVDIRDEYQFLQNHLEGAVNIPMNYLLDEENIKILDQATSDSLQIIFYGENQIQSNAAWMLSYQIGYTNTKVMMGGFDLVNDPEFDPDQIAAYLIEEPIFDFYMMMEEARDQIENPIQVVNEPAMEIIPIKRVENNIDEGGC
jgi:rhodanese-related sulfurtransferase